MNKSESSANRFINQGQLKSAKSSKLTQIVARLPNRFHRFRFRALGLVTPVQPREEDRVIAHFREKRRLFAGVAERIDLPADSRPRTFSKSVLQELQSVRELIHDALVVRGSFVVHRPGSTDKLETTLVDQHFHLFLQFCGLLEIPLREEGRLDVDELPCRILQQSLDDCVDDARYIGFLYSILALGLTAFRAQQTIFSLPLTAIVVLIDCLQPPDIIVRMRHQMNINHV